MTDSSLLPLCQPPSWIQYTGIPDALVDQRTRMERLVRVGYLKEDTPFASCKKGRCGLGFKPQKGRASPSPYRCSAFCRLAQVRLECNEVQRIARTLSKVDPNPLLVTVVNPAYWIDLKKLPSFTASGIKQSTGRALRRASLQSGQRIVAIGRVDFDLGDDGDGRTVVRPHVHLIVAGSDERTLKRYLRPKMDRNRYRTLIAVDVKPVHDSGALRYALKCRIGGLSNSGNGPPDFKQARQRPGSQAEINFDRFLLNQQLGDLLILSGMRRYGSKVVVCE